MTTCSPVGFEPYLATSQEAFVLEDTYRHMRVIPLDEAESDSGSVPGRLSPQFSLAFLRQASDPALLLTPDGRVTFLNDAACNLFGLERVEDVHGRQIWELWPDPEAAPVLKHALKGVASGDAVRFPAISENGDETHQWMIILSPVIDAEGAISSVFFLSQPA